MAPSRGAAQIDLHHVRAQGHRGGEGGQRVLPVLDRLAPVGDGDDAHVSAGRRALRAQAVPA